MFQKPSVTTYSNGIGLFDNREAFAPKEITEGKKKPYLSFSEILSQPPKKWILEGWFGKGELGIIYGPSGSGKTFILIDLMFCAALEKTFAGQFTFNERLKTLYVCGEGFHGAIDRIKSRASLQRLPEDFDEYFLIQRDMIDLSSDESTNAFIKYYKDMGLGLIAIDTLNIAANGTNENDNAAMSMITMRAMRIAEELNAVVILIHHSNKAGTGMRGASSIKGHCDFVIEIDRTEKKRVMGCEKLKDGDEWNKIEFSLKGIPNFDGGTSAIVEWGGEHTKPVTHNKAIRMFLEKNPDNWFTYEMIVEQLGNKDGDNPLSESTVRVECGKLCDDGIAIKSDDKDLKRSLGIDTKKTIVKFNKGSF